MSFFCFSLFRCSLPPFFFSLLLLSGFPLFSSSFECQSRYPIQNPLLSVVFTTQGGTFGELPSDKPEQLKAGRNTFRFLRQIWWLTECSKRFNVPMEIVVVDWPVEKETPERERILKALVRENETIPNSVQQLRILEAPKEFTKLSEKSLPVLEYTGKNVGARRALGKFILLGGTDSLPHEGIFQFISQHPENITGCIGAYRQVYHEGFFPSRPWDFHQFVEWRDSPTTQWISSQMKANPQVYDPQTPPTPILSQKPHWNAAGDFTLCTRPALAKIGGYPETPNRNHVDTALLKYAKHCSVKLQVFHRSLSCFHQPHSKTVSSPHGVRPNYIKTCPKPHVWGFPETKIKEILFSNGKKELFSKDCVPNNFLEPNEEITTTTTTTI